MSKSPAACELVKVDGRFCTGFVVEGEGLADDASGAGSGRVDALNA
jgi:hypothetical protein